MPKSAAFIRIKKAVIAVVGAIPAGRVTSFLAIGSYLDVMPRHVAYILAQLTDEEREEIPWHRVVNEEGNLGRIRSNAFGITQAELLQAEGIIIESGQQVRDFESVFFPITQASTGVDPLPRQPYDQGNSS